MATKNRQRTLYLITAAAMAALIGGYALAATSITTISPQQSSNITQSPSPGDFSGIATVSSEQLVILSNGMSTSATAGTETAGAVGLDGTPTALAVCATNPCALQNFITAVPATASTGNFSEQIVLSVTQPAGAATNALGFDMEITVSVTVGVTTANVNALAYLSTNANGGGSATTVSAFIFVDLGTAIPPTVNSVSVVFNQCATATACP